MSCGGPVLQCSTQVGCKRIGKEQNAVIGFGPRFKGDCNVLPGISFGDSKWKNVPVLRRRSHVGVPWVCKESQAPMLQSGRVYASVNKHCTHKHCLLKRKGQEVASCLNGHCIFLVGMMGSGKTTVGKILSEALGYTFVDSDKYIEQAVGGISVAQIFEECGESFFRDIESEVMQKLSLMPQHVVATGGGVVTRSANWEYMRQGITVFLNVPLDALAKRIAAVGTDSRPLLQFDSADPYTKAFMGLFTLSKKRIEAYSNADTTVSLSDIVDKLGLDEVCDLTPTAIAIEVLLQIDNYLQAKAKGPSKCSLN